MDLFTGAAYAFRGLGLIHQSGLRRYVAIPLVINTVLFGLVIGFGASRFARLMDAILPSGLEWLEWLLWPLFAAAALVVVFFTFTLVANLAGAPFNGLLAEAVERHLAGEREADGGFRKLASEFVSSLISEARKTAYFVLWSVPLLVLFLIPLVNLVAPILWVGFSAWMLAIEYADFPMGNHGIDFLDRRSRLRANRFLALGFGGGVLVMMMIPGLNFVAMPASVAGATLMWVERLGGPHSAV